MIKIHSKNRNAFIYLLLIFIIPMVVSWILFHYHHHFRLKTTNHGTLLNSPSNVKNIWVENEKKWQIVYVTGRQCDHHCEEVFSALNQVKKALGKNTDRVKVKKMQPDFSFANESNQNLSEKNFVINNKIYLVDPVGNLFMYYPDATNPMDILKDMKRVLEVSQIG